VEVDTPHRCDPGWSYVASLACLPGGTTRTLRPSRSIEVFGMVLHSSQLVARASESAKTTRPALRLLSVLEIGLFYGNDRERKWRVFGWHTELPEVQPDRGEAA
jgi:hypothetical protein